MELSLLFHCPLDMYKNLHLLSPQISAIVFWAAAALASFQEQKALESERAAGIDASMAEPLAPEEA